MSTSRFKVRTIRTTVAGTDALFAKLPKRLNLVLLRSLAKSLNISEISSHGNSGKIVGSPSDIVVMGRYLRTHSYGDEMTTLVKNFLGGQGTYFDIGANIGLTAIPIAQSGSQCICFEPDPTCFDYLRRNIESNCPPGSVTLHHVGVLDRTDTIKFRRSAWNFGDNRVVGKGDVGDVYDEQNWEEIEVHAVTIDSILDEATLTGLPRPFFAKMDIQGSEVGAVRGGMHFFSSLDAMILEFWPLGIRGFGEDPEYLVDFIGSNFSRGMVFEDFINKSFLTNTNWANEKLVPISELVEKMRHHASLDVISHIDVLVTK